VGFWSKEHPPSLRRYAVSTISYTKHQNTTALPLALLVFKALGFALIRKASLIRCGFFEEFGKFIGAVWLVFAYEMFV